MAFSEDKLLIPRFCPLVFGLTCLLLLTGVPVSLAKGKKPEDPDKPILTLQFENDMFGGTDRHFTHGMRLSYLTNEGHEGVKDLARKMPFFAEGGNARVSFALGQNIFTPQDISIPDPDPTDRPYAGWLYGSIGLINESGGRLDNLQLDVGVVGPLSYAEQVQTGWHDLLGLVHPEGWAHQLSNEPGVVLYYERKFRPNWLKSNDLPTFGPFEDLGLSLSPYVGGALGNVYTYVGAGAIFRFGDELPEDYGPPRIRPSLPGSDFFKPYDGNAMVGWYVFAAVEGRAMARNIFLDGNTFKSSASVEKKPLVGDLQLGAAILFGNARLAYTHIFRTKEFYGQDTLDQFGGLSLSYRF